MPCGCQTDNSSNLCNTWTKKSSLKRGKWRPYGNPIAGVEQYTKPKNIVENYGVCSGSKGSYSNLCQTWTKQPRY